jgi:GTP-binding protein Era
MGPPNVGKSAILNSLVGAHVAAITRKRHTTRRKLLGVFNHKRTQLAFYDTPGYISEHEARSKQEISLRRESAQAAKDADIVLLVVDAARRLQEKFDFEFAELAKLAYAGARKEVVLVLNKVDIVEPKDRLLEVTEKYVSLMNGARLGEEGQHLAQLDVTTFMISALKDDGVIDLKNYLLSSADYKPWVLDKEQGSTNQTDEELVEQIVYEKFLENIHDEIPFIAVIKCTSISDLTDSRILIKVTIKVDTPNQQRMVIGHQGRSMLKLRQAASKLLEAIMHKDVILEFSIIVKGSKEDIESREVQDE